MMSTCIEMAFFPPNFMLHEDHHHHDHQPSTSLNPLLPSCTPQDFHGVGSFLGKRSMSSYSGGGEMGGDELSDDGSQQGGEKKRRLNMEQVKTLEKNFELGNKLEPERKMQLARALGLQPRQIAIWFQNRRARWKTKQLEKDYDLLKTQFDAIKAQNDALQTQNHKLHAEIMALKKRENNSNNQQQPTESINLNKETEGSCSNSSAEIKLADISAIDSHPRVSRSLFPPPSSASMAHHHLFNNNQSRPSDHHSLKLDHSSSAVKEESLSNMFCALDDQSGFWPWLDQQHFN